MNNIETDRLEKRPDIGYDNLYSGVSSYIDVKDINLFWKENSGKFVNDVLIANDIPFKEFNYYDGYAYQDKKNNKEFLKDKRIRIYYVIENEISKEKLGLIYQIGYSKRYLHDALNTNPEDNNVLIGAGNYDNKKNIFIIININIDQKEYRESILNYYESDSYFVVLKEDSFDGFPAKLKKVFQEYEGGKILATPSLMPKLFFSCRNCYYLFKGVKNKNSSVVLGSNSIFSSNSYLEFEDLLLHEGSVFIGDNSYLFYKKESFYDYDKGMYVIDYDKQKIGNNILIGKHTIVNAKYIGDNVAIGNESVLEDYCYIGNNTYIQTGVKINQRNSIGSYANVSVNPNKILGYDYFRSSDANYSEWIKELTRKSLLDI